MKKRRWGRWFKEIDIGIEEFANWLNRWGDVEEKIKFYKLTLEDRALYRAGYHQAVKDVYNKLGLDFKIFDKRTKTGYRKEVKE